MIQYEVYIVGEKEPCIVFDSGYEIKQSERLFIERESVTYFLNVSKVTHNLISGSHVVRLTCHKTKYKQG